MPFNMRTHGETGTRLFRVWSGMWERCTNPHHASYKYYGGRGISVCVEWSDYLQFKSWAMANGYDPKAPRGEYTLDRIDSNGPYSPCNCRLVSKVEQANNKRNNRSLTVGGETHTVAEWSRISGIDSATIRARIDRLGWTVERALSVPQRRLHYGKAK